MSNRTKAVATLTLCAALSGGCGTLYNLPPPGPAPFLGPGDHGSRTYGGVREEWEVLMGKNNTQDYDRIYRMVAAPFLALDLPFTLIGDTITLPYTLAYDCGLFGRICVYRTRGENREENPRPDPRATEPADPPKLPSP